MSEDKTIPVTLASYPLEEKLLDMMADQQQEFGTFKKNVQGRLAQLEHMPRRSMAALLDLGFDSVVSLALLAAGILIFVRVLIYMIAQSKVKGETDGKVSMSRA